MALSRSALAGLDLWRLFSTMSKISYASYRFPPEIIQQAIWLYVRFTLSFRDVEDLLAERDIMVSYETVRRWVNHFGPKIAADLRKRRPIRLGIWTKSIGKSMAVWSICGARRRRGRSARCAGPNQEKQAGGAQINVQAFEKIWRCLREARHG